MSKNDAYLKSKSPPAGAFRNRKPPPPLPDNSTTSWWEETHDGKHGKTPPRWKYDGFCDTTPTHHAFKCVAPPNTPQVKVVLIPFKSDFFSPKSRAGQGGCSTYRCPANAIMMAAAFSRAYCDLHARRVNPQVEARCTAVNIIACDRRLYHQDTCVLCLEYYSHV